MDIHTLIKTDMNLLVTLHVLYEERSVSAAAQRLFVTQSAVSKALARMRERFGDPLFSRVGHGLVPTPYLDSVAPLLMSILNDITRLLAPKEFNPESCQAEINVTFPETIDIIITPRLLAYLQQVAPGIRLKSQRHGEDVLERLANGAVDFAVSLEYSHYPKEFETEHFFRSLPAVIARKGHPLEQQEPSYENMTAYPRIEVRLPDQSLTEFYRSITARRSKTRPWPAVIETESLMSALAIARLTDCLLPVPDVVARALISRNDLQKFAMPTHRDAIFNYLIVSHQRISESAMHHWFRQILKGLGREIAAGIAE